MTAKRRRRGRLVAALLGCFFTGGVAGWWLRDKGPPRPVVTTLPATSLEKSSQARAPSAPKPATEEPVATGGDPVIAPAPRGSEPGGALEELHARGLRLPIDGAEIEALKGGFGERRGTDRSHEAIDILAPRHTPVHAVEDGVVAKLFHSKAGGLTIYQFDPTRRFCYYYAHLERYADGLKEGQHVSRGEVVGYVGTSGNAPPQTPHLHFAVFALTPEQRWWQGQPLDPYRIFHKGSG